MKKVTFLLLFAAALFLYSCVSREEPNSVTIPSAMTAVNNGSNWEVTLTDTIQNDSIQLHGRSKLDLLRIKLPEVTSTGIPLTDITAQYYIYTTNGTTIAQNFVLDKSYKNVANITVNTPNRSITGQFNLRFVINKLAINPDTTGTDTDTFTQGTFQAPIPIN